MKRKLNLDTIDYVKLQKLSEKTLRQNVIIPLLDDIEADNVTDMHGSEEEGIDVYFETNDIFGHKRRFGIQIKKGNIICQNSPSPQSVITILNQIEAAFSKENILVDSKQGKISVHIDGYYIITSGRVNKPAKTRIYQKRKAYPFVHIIQGGELLRIIKDRKFLRRRILEIPTDTPMSLLINRTLKDK